MKPTQTLMTIKKLVENLPPKDIPIAERFIAQRNFPMLQELVDSALYKINKNLASENPKKEYETLNVELIEELAVAVDSYITTVYGESIRLNAADLVDEDDEYYDNFDEYDLNDIY